MPSIMLQVWRKFHSEFYVLFLGHSKTHYEEEHRLLTSLYKRGIHPDVLPMVKGPVNVTFGLTLNQIVDVVRT